MGYGQLAWDPAQRPPGGQPGAHQRPVSDPREQIPEAIQFFSVDVSFISLGIILPAVRPLLAEGARAVCLIKPQFEAGREKVGKKGVVRDRKVHEEVICRIQGLALENGYSPCWGLPSPR